MSSTPYHAPRLSLRVGVTGHRPNRLAAAPARLQDQAQSVLRHLRRIVRRLRDENVLMDDAAPFAVDAGPSLRLATCLAAGADSFVAEAALEEGYDLSLILPFPHELYVSDFSATERDVFDRLWANRSDATSRLELDVSRKPQDPEAYLAAGRVMLSHSDVLIAVWDGKPAAGTGGTAEVVNEARRRGLIVVVLPVDGGLHLWTPAEDAEGDGPAGKWSALSIREDQDAGSDELAQRVRSVLWLPESDAGSIAGHGGERRSPEDCLQHFRHDRERNRSSAFAYDLLNWVFRRKPSPRPWVDYTKSTAYAEPHWKAVRALATDVGGERFAVTLDSAVERRWAAADNLANHYAAKFRSAYVTNFSLAAFAVLFGLLIVFVDMDKDALFLVKFWLVTVEVAFIATILWTTWRARRQHWQERWLDYRSLAEALRPARLPLLMGSSPLASGIQSGLTPGEVWVSWYVRSSLREIAPPSGVIGTEALRRLIDLAVKHEIDPQIEYHDDNAKKLMKLDHGMEKLAGRLLWATLLLGATYLILYCGYYAIEDSTWRGALKSLLAVVKPIVTFSGGTLPVFGAALFGIRATGDFRASIRQSQRTRANLTALKSKLKAQDSGPSRPILRQTLSQVIRTMSDDVTIWGMIYSERTLEAGF